MAVPGDLAGAIVPPLRAAVVPIERHARKDKTSHAVADCAEKTVNCSCNTTKDLRPQSIDFPSLWDSRLVCWPWVASPGVPILNILN